MRTEHFVRLMPLLAVLFVFPTPGTKAQSWTAKLDKAVRFYQATDMGVLLVGTEKSLYAIDASTGETLWRRKDASLDETDVAPIPGSDLVLLAFEKGERTRVEAVDIFSGDTIWKSDKMRGGVMQMAVDPSANLLAVVLAKDARGRAKEGFKRHPLLHVLNLASGEEIWKYEVSETEMMPSRWPDGGDSDVDYTLDNYRPPVFVDGRLYLFYEGLTSFDARTGKARLREKYRVNEDGLALTEAEAIFDQDSCFTRARDVLLHGSQRRRWKRSGWSEHQYW